MPRQQFQQVVESDVMELCRRLKLGEIVPATVSRVLGDGHYAVKLRGETVLAQSHLALDKGVLYAVVECLQPKIRLRLIPLESAHAAEAMIRLALQHKISLDLTAQTVLGHLLRHGDVPADLPAFVNGCRALVSLLPRGAALGPALLLALVSAPPGEGEPVLDVLLSLLSMQGQLLPEDNPLPCNSAAHAWLFLRLDGHDHAWRLVAPSPLRERLERWHAVLGLLNANLQDVMMQAWLLPEGNRLRLELAELSSSGGVSTCRVWQRSEVFGDVRVQVQWSPDTARAALGFDNSIVAREFGRQRDDLQAQVADHLPGCELRVEVDQPLGARV